ncbi:MAG: hypothetical protein M1836_008116 [Candelina mexicana]|nr:MAG: hypothetical protein M1836_008116 [Candelina mexicana]
MPTSLQVRELGGGYHSKRGHAPQISISDDNHHVTEAIGVMYGETSYAKRDPRPLSFQTSPLNDSAEQAISKHSDSARPMASRLPNPRTISNERVSPTINGQGKMPRRRSSPIDLDDGPLSPRLAMNNRSPSDTATAQFPLNDIDYESNPAAVAQELSNLQALRRMSMDHNAAGDPDLPAFNTGLGMPPVAPTASDDEDDASRLFWVPARLHPELAPKEFKTFIEGRVDQIRRRSGEHSLSPDGPQRQESGGGLRRKKSMLSRQIDNSGGKGAEGYTDGAERLDRKRSLSAQQSLDPTVSNLQDLEVLVNDPATAMRKLSIEANREDAEARLERPAGDDRPILPAAPPGQSLRRSTRTTYRRGSLRKGERVPFSKRGGRPPETDTDDSPLPSPIALAEPMDLGLSRVKTDPVQAGSSPPRTENFSRPSRIGRGPAPTPITIPATTSPEKQRERAQAEPVEHLSAPAQPPAQWKSRFATNGRTTARRRSLVEELPKIVKTPPPPEESPASAVSAPQNHIPERVSSHEPPPSRAPQAPLPHAPTASRPLVKPALIQHAQNASKNRGQTLHDMASHPSPLPGNSTRTDSLSFIPTLAEDKKADKKHKDKKEKDSSESGGRKSSWGWLLGNEEKEKEKKEEKEAQKRGKTKIAKPVDKSSDNTRLDLLQTSIDGGRGRESLVLDRDSMKLEEERRKESSRKSSGGDSKKEKESGLFSSFFGGGKKKGDRDSSGKKGSSLRALSPDPPYRVLKADIDYNWTRFSILEERAIYRMAHIKLANPRRALYSQVLLSNFMYSYLAKVQQMHPQIQIPQSASQKNKQGGQNQQQQSAQSRSHGGHQHQHQNQQEEQPDEYYQYQKYQEQQSQSEGVNYVDDSQIYDYDHQDHEDRSRPQSRASQHSTSENGNPYGPSHNNHHTRSQQSGKHGHYGGYQSSQLDDSNPRDEDMW